MSNVVAVGNLKKLISYLPDGVKVQVDAMVRGLDPATQFADNLALYANGAVSSTAAAVSSTAGSRPLLMIVQSAGTKCWVHLYNDPSATAGVNVDFPIPVSGTSGAVSVVNVTGTGWDEFWDTGIAIASSTATETSSAPGNLPKFWMIYASS